MKCNKIQYHTIDTNKLSLEDLKPILSKTFDNDNLRFYNFEVCKYLGGCINTAVMLADIHNQHKIFKDELVEKDGKMWFFYTHSRCESRTGMKRSSQDTALRNLERIGLVEKIRMGKDGKRHIYFNEDEFFKILYVLFIENQKKSDTQKKQSKNNNNNSKVKKRLGLRDPTNGNAESSKPDCEIRQTRHYRYKSKREEQERESACAQPPPDFLNEESSEENDYCVPADLKRGYGYDGLVKLTDKEFAQLRDYMGGGKKGEENLLHLCENLNDHLASEGKECENPSPKLRRWWREDQDKKKPGSVKSSAFEKNERWADEKLASFNGMRCGEWRFTLTGEGAQFSKGATIKTFYFKDPAFRSLVEAFIEENKNTGVKNG